MQAARLRSRQGRAALGDLAAVPSRMLLTKDLTVAEAAHGSLLTAHPIHYVNGMWHSTKP